MAWMRHARTRVRERLSRSMIAAAASSGSRRPVLRSLEHDTSDPGALGRRVELLGDLGDELVARVDVIVGGGVEKLLDLWAADLRERERESEIEFGEFDQFVEDVLEFVVIEMAQATGGIAGVTGEERAGEVVLAGSALLTAAVLGFAT